MKIQSHTLSLDVPDERDGIGTKESPVHAAALEVATSPLAQIRDVEADSPFGAIGAEDIYIRVEDHGDPPPYVGTEGSWSLGSLPVQIETSEIVQSLHGGIPLGAVRPLVLNGRAVVVTVGFGSTPSEATLSEANAILTSLTVSS